MTTPDAATWTGAAPPVERMIHRTLPIALIGGILAYAIMRAYLYVVTPSEVWGMDHAWVMGQASRVLSGGPVYAASELAGPIVNGTMADLYPPTTVFLLFVPLSFLPAFVWWAVPLLTIGAVVWHHRPSLWGWVAILIAFVLWPHTWTAIQLGNPAMWIAMFVALGTVYRWPAALVLLKPTLAPLSLIGVRSRWWWVVCVGLGLVSLAMIPAWLDYLVVLRNLTGFDWTYSFHDLGFVLIPVIAWRARRWPGP